VGEGEKGDLDAFFSWQPLS